MTEKTRKNTEKGLLVAAAETIGKAAGKLAALSGAEPKADLPVPAPGRKTQKLVPKKKERLPRREKKMMKKGKRPAARKRT